MQYFAINMLCIIHYMTLYCILYTLYYIAHILHITNYRSLLILYNIYIRDILSIIYNR